MSQSVSRKRPWLAALLAALVTGLGHIYLRRWRRALWWLTILFVAATLFVDPAALDAIAGGDPIDVREVAPILIVGGFSVVDAYLLAHSQNAVAGPSGSSDGRLEHCPNCGKEIDPDLEFCHWCTMEIAELKTSRPSDRDERDDRSRQ